MAYEHKSGIARAFDRAEDRPDWQGVVFGGDGERFIQGAELNEAQTIARGRHNRLGRLIAKDGDRVEGAVAIVDYDLGQVILTAGKLFIGGDVLPVATAILEVDTVGSVQIGVRVTTEWVTHEDDPTPAADYWAVSNTVWASPETVEFNRGVRRNNGPLVVTTEAMQVVDQRQEQAAFLRQIAVAFRIEGMGPGELLETLTFDGINVKPPGDPAADAGGVLEGNFTIPSNVPVGSKLVAAEGAGGSTAEAGFVGQGVINTTTMRRVTTIERWRREPRQNNNSGGSDPLAQTFSPVEPRQLVGVDVHLCLIGAQTNSLLVQQVGVEVGIPNEEVIAEAFVPMIGAAVGWKSARYNLPVFTPADRPSAIVIKTDDADHSLSIASLGGFDTDLQSYVGAQPYTTGVLLSSSNAQTWTPHQNDDLTFRLVAAKFGPLTKTVSLGTFELVDCSDLQVRAEVEAPSADCSVVFEIVRADASIIRLLPYQVLQLTEYVTETVQLRAILSGTEKLSPTLFAPVILVAGEIAAEGTYVTRAFKLGVAVKLTSYMKTMLPSGATLEVMYDKADDDWIALPLSATELLTDPAWVEKKFEATGITATEGRLKLTITGGPAARPLVGDLGAAVM